MSACIYTFRPPAHLINVHVSVELVAVLADPVQELENRDAGLLKAPSVSGVLGDQAVRVVVERGRRLNKYLFKKIKQDEVLSAPPI